MKKTTAILFAALLAIVPLSAHATAERPVISVSSFEEWVKAGVDNGWIVDNKVVEQSKPDAEPTANEGSEPATEEVVRPKEKSLAIIDSYFDSSVSVSENVCVATTGCDITLASKSGLLSNAANHGNGMVEVAKRQNPDVSIIAIRSANATARFASEMTTGDFIRALTWVNDNSSSVGAVSVSRFFNGTKSCTPNAAGTAEFGGVVEADTKIKTLISSLSQKGIPVFAATGNKFRGAVDYPACISTTNSVGVGVANKFGATVSRYSFDLDTDYFASSTVISYQSSLFGKVPNTTSAGTVAVATKHVSGLLDGKFVSVLP